MSFSNILSVIALSVSLWVAWLSFYHRRPKATVQIRGFSTKGEVDRFGDTSSLAYEWKIAISNVGKVPLVLMGLDIGEVRRIEMNGELGGFVRSIERYREEPPTTIGVDEVKVATVTAKPPEDADYEYDPTERMTIRMTLLSSRGTATVKMSAMNSPTPTVVSDFR